MNNKGFMMAEVVVVSSVILVTLVSLYASYNKIISVYNQRIDYYDVSTLYELDNIRRNSDYSKNDLVDDTDKVVTILDEEYRKVYWLRTTDLDTVSVNSPKFNDYLRYLYDSVIFEKYDVFVMENCINNDIDNCKYAYLEGEIDGISLE